MPIPDYDVTFLKGVGEKRARLLKKLGIETVGDIISFYPRSYEDFSSPTGIIEAVPGQTCCIRAFVSTPVRESMIRRGMTIYRLTAMDSTGSVKITFFNNRYIKDLLKEGDEYLFYGKLTQDFGGRQMAAPEFLPASETGLIPVYPQTEGVNSRMLRNIIRQAVKLCADDLSDTLPETVRREYKLCHLRFAQEKIHFPKSPEELETARRRLVFEELLTLQLGMYFIRKNNRKTTSAVCLHAQDFSEFERMLPYKLTGAQKKAILECAGDMSKSTPMNRLLQGDVGSGKTAVAAALCWFAAKSGYQSALMAPTEILAQQHYRSLSAIFTGCGISCALITGGTPEAEKKRIREMLKSGKPDVVIGTHALLQQNVEFLNLGLVITDEQHRFGVRHRAVLTEKGVNPHTLVMSATPIPRTLALIIYGDLDISVLDEMPAGRRNVNTYFVDSSKRGRVYAFIKKLLDEGRQAFIVCPVIEQGENGLTAASDYAKSLASGAFSRYRVGLLHGRLRPAEKERIMQDFCSGMYSVLVSTTVIEVGVDVPNAVIMVVENAERFGFSQLHQLRGRVGRGTEQSYCILISDAQNRESTVRLNYMCKTHDGFKIAEKDLEQRGPGDFFGHRQHGLPEMKIADLCTDLHVLHEAQQAAHSIIENDPQLSKPEYAGLKKGILRLFRSGEEIIFN